MNESDAIEKFEAFLTDFYEPPNELSAGVGIAQLEAAIEAASRSIAAGMSRPIVLPAKTDGVTRYFGIAFTSDQARSLRSLLTAFVGNTWTDYHGQSLADSEGALDPLEWIAVHLAVEPSFVFTFRVAPTARATVSEVIRALVRSLEDRPMRELQVVQPIGRLLGEFDDACAFRAQNSADVAFTKLAADHRISATNRLFLRVRLLAAFERWNELEQLPNFKDLLKLDRPTLVSDALARLAFARLGSEVTPDRVVALDYGAIVPSVRAIRSDAGARYYASWALAAGEAPHDLLARLSKFGWQDVPELRLFDSATTNQIYEDPDAVRLQAARAFESGRLDSVVELLQRLTLIESDLPVVLTVVRETLTPGSYDLLERCRVQLGDDRVQAAIDDMLRAGRPRMPEALMPFGERLGLILDPTVDSAMVNEVISELKETVTDLLDPATMTEAIAVVEHANNTNEPRLGPSLDCCIDLCRDLVALDSAIARQQDLAFSVLELWAYHDESGDRSRARRMINLLSGMLEAGIGQIRFREIVDLVTHAWKPMYTDADLELGLDTVELLAAYEPEGVAEVTRFATPLLARLGPHNVARVSPAALAVASVIAPEFGLRIEMPEPVASDETPTAESQLKRPVTVAIYSLMTSSALRAARLLEARFSNLEAITLSDHVATTRMVGAAGSCDVLVVVDRAAKHAATDALKAARGSKPLTYARGKGSTSIFEAAVSAIDELDLTRE